MATVRQIESSVAVGIGAVGRLDEAARSRGCFVITHNIICESWLVRVMGVVKGGGGEGLGEALTVSSSIAVMVTLVGETCGGGGGQSILPDVLLSSICGDQKRGRLGG